MSAKWSPVILSEVVEIKHGWAFKGNYMSEDADEGPVVVAIGNFDYSGGFRFSSTKLKRYSGLYPREYQLQAGDILLAMTCQTAGGEILGLPGMIPDDGELYLHNQRLGKLIVKQPDCVYAPYLYWVFLSYDFNRYLAGSATGTKILHTSPSKIVSYETRLPPVDVQKDIARFLWAISDKAALNQKINQTLEEIAQAIFKSWFVDFDPVKAKMAALEAGGSEADALLAAMRTTSGKSDEQLERIKAESPERYAELEATAELFPSAMQESELGEIPEGWEVLPLSNMVDLIGGGTPKKSEPSYWNGDICWFSVKDAPSDGNVFVIDTEEKITDVGLSASSTKLLPIGTTIITARGTVGKLALTGVVTAMNQSCYGVVGNDGAGPYLNYLRINRAVDTLRRNTHGAVFDTITRTTFETVVQPQPCLKLRQRFEKVVEPVFEAIKRNLHQSETLCELRDTLLPKLLSGELTIPEAEEQVVERQDVAHV